MENNEGKNGEQQLSKKTDEDFCGKIEFAHLIKNMCKQLKRKFHRRWCVWKLAWIWQQI